MRGLKLILAHKRVNIELKFDINFTHADCGVLNFFQNKKANDSAENIFQKQSTFNLPYPYHSLNLEKKWSQDLKPTFLFKIKG